MTEMQVAGLIAAVPLCWPAYCILYCLFGPR